MHLSDAGHEHAEELIAEAGLLQPGESLYDAANIRLMHHLNAALRAHALYHRDVEYIVRNGEVIIVDEFTGRTMPGRRWSDGLHQAVEAKEGVRVREENQTVASITFQNYFRMYSKLAGMTGTADTEAFEFQSIYGLEVVGDSDAPADGPQGPLRLRVSDAEGQVRRDHRGHPRLRARAASRRWSARPRSRRPSSCRSCSKKQKIPHEVLNAKQHEREAQIVAQAGRPGAVTIATNMAGRGTDIVLGGNLEAELHQMDPADEAARASARARNGSSVTTR